MSNPVSLLLYQRIYLPSPPSLLVSNTSNIFEHTSLCFSVLVIHYILLCSRRYHCLIWLLFLLHYQTSIFHNSILFCNCNSRKCGLCLLLIEILFQFSFFYVSGLSDFFSVPLSFFSSEPFASISSFLFLWVVSTLSFLCFTFFFFISLGRLNPRQASSPTSYLRSWLVVHSFTRQSSTVTMSTMTMMVMKWIRKMATMPMMMGMMMSMTMTKTENRLLFYPTPPPTPFGFVPKILPIW